jgi:hypothetical protein
MQSKNQIELLLQASSQQKLSILTLALEIMKNWNACCEEALQEGCMIGLHSTKNSLNIHNCTKI